MIKQKAIRPVSPVEGPEGLLEVLSLDPGPGGGGRPQLDGVDGEAELSDAGARR
jgi:hypothetical protein